jgi:hypothetical protein
MRTASGVRPLKSAASLETGQPSWQEITQPPVTRWSGVAVTRVVGIATDRTGALDSIYEIVTASQLRA